MLNSLELATLFIKDIPVSSGPNRVNSVGSVFSLVVPTSSLEPHDCKSEINKPRQYSLRKLEFILFEFEIEF